MNVSDIVTVTDFLQGNDLLSESSTADPLVKIAGVGDNAAQALNDANNFYVNSGRPAAVEYVFVYGGTGAGYLFHNSIVVPSGGTFVTSGMAILDATGENSVMASDITTIPSNIPA